MESSFGVYSIVYFFDLDIVYIFFVVRELFLSVVYRASTSIPPMIIRAWLLILLLFPSLGLRSVLTGAIYFFFTNWLKFGDFSFLLLGGSKRFVISWVVEFVGIILNVGWIISLCLLFCLLFWFNSWFCLCLLVRNCSNFWL